MSSKELNFLNMVKQRFVIWYESLFAYHFHLCLVHFELSLRHSAEVHLVNLIQTSSSSFWNIEVEENPKQNSTTGKDEHGT